jgi:serine protease
VRPRGAAPGSSLVNFAAGRDVPNTTIVGVDSTGKITVRLRAVPSRAHVIIDVSGWISTSSHDVRGSRLVPVGPARLADTRNTGAPLRGGQTLPLQVRGATSFEPTVAGIVPNSPAVTAVMVNLVAINWQPGSRPTYVTATPTPLPPGVRPTVSNVNLPAGIVKTNMAIVPIGPDGRIHLFNFDGDLHLAVDVLGYFVTDATATTSGRIVPLSAPFRALDTRDISFGSAPLGGGTAEDWSFNAFASSVQIGGQPAGTQSALIGNLTATDLTRTVPWAAASTYLTAYPAGVGRPLVSNVNLAEGEVVPNMSLVKYGNAGAGSEAVKLYNHDGSVHYVLDVYAVVLS